MEKDTKGSSNEKGISTERPNWALHHSGIRGPSVANRTSKVKQFLTNRWFLLTLFLLALGIWAELYWMGIVWWWDKL